MMRRPVVGADPGAEGHPLWLPWPTEGRHGGLPLPTGGRRSHALSEQQLDRRGGSQDLDGIIENLLRNLPQEQDARHGPQAAISGSIIRSSLSDGPVIRSRLTLNGTLSQLTAKKNQALVPTKANLGSRMASR